MDQDEVAAASAAKDENSEEDGEEDALCPLFLQAGCLPEGFASSKTLEVAGALVEAEDEAPVKASGKAARRTRRGARQRFEPTRRPSRPKKEPAKRGDQQDAAPKSPQDANSRKSVDVGQVQVFMSMWNVS